MMIYIQKEVKHGAIDSQIIPSTTYYDNNNNIFFVFSQAQPSIYPCLLARTPSEQNRW
jgi:hypothetical protein